MTAGVTATAHVAVREQYARLIAVLAREDTVVGVWLGGSRGKGYHDERSDYDVVVVVRDASVVPRVEALVAPLALDEEIGVSVKTLGDLRGLSRWGRPDRWMRYAFTDTKAVLDKTGELQPLIERIGRFPPRRRHALINRALDAYLNAVYRSVKAYGRGQAFAARLEASHAIEHLLVALFALHGRFKPYNDYLDRETHLLHRLGGLENGLIERLSDVIAAAAPQAQFRLRDDMERVFRAHGFGEVFDSWREQWAGVTRKHDEREGRGGE